MRLLHCSVNTFHLIVVAILLQLTHANNYHAAPSLGDLSAGGIPATARHPQRPITTPTAAAVNMGTTLVAIRYDDGVVVGADSRTSVGGFVSHRYADKLASITSHCTVLRSGSAADTQVLVLRCRHHVREHELRHGGGGDGATTTTMSVTEIARWMRQAVRQQRGQASLLVAGYHTERGVPCIYSVALSGALLEEGPYAAAGSGSVYVLGYLDHHIGRRHRDRDDDDEASSRSLTQDEAIRLCRNAIALAASRDGSSGGVVRLAVIDKDGTRQLEARPVVEEGIRGDAAVLTGFAASSLSER